MLKVINLYVIDRIFRDVSRKKLSPNAQILYINCLTHHFKNLEPKEVNCNAFEILIDEFPNFKKYTKVLTELEEEGLIDVGNGRVMFYNEWSKFIDRNMLDIPMQEVTSKPIAEFKNELIESDSLIELSSLKFKISKLQVAKLIELFVVEQTAFKKEYLSVGDCIKHCSNWMQYNHHKVPKEIIKSGNKMLGK
jgi:hypothetical protein